MRLENRFLKTFREKETGHTGHLGKLRSELPSAGNTKDHVNGQMDTACGKHGKKRNGNLEDLGAQWSIILKGILGEKNFQACNRFI